MKDIIMKEIDTKVDRNEYPAVRTTSKETPPSEATAPILCHYVNATSRLQIARITNVPKWYFERVVFPGQNLIFEAPRWAKLEIHKSELSSVILLDKIHCDRLQVREGTEKQQ